jgi:hypothetical protein
MKYAPGRRMLYGRGIQNWGSFVKGLSASFPRFLTIVPIKARRFQHSKDLTNHKASDKKTTYVD